MTVVPEHARTAQRSLVATLEVTGLATSAHVLAGGHLPNPVFLLAFGAVVLVGAFLTIGRYLRVAAVVPFVLVAQLALHAGVEATQPSHHAMDMGADPGLLHTTPLMFWAHLVTAVASAIVLLLQERVLPALVTWARALVVVAPPAPRRTSAPAYVVRGARQVLLRTSPRRGPPVALAAAR